LLHHLLLAIFLDHDVFDCVLSYFDRAWCVYPDLCICRAHCGWWSLHHTMSLHTLDQQRVAIWTCLEVLTCSNTYLRCAWLLFLAHLLQGEIPHVFILRKHNTSLAVSRVFIPTILLLVLLLVRSLDGWLHLRELTFIDMELIIIINDLLLHADVIWIYLRSAIIILIL